jgi:hypothetical protein
VGVEAEQVVAVGHLDAAVACERRMLRCRLAHELDTRLRMGGDDGLSYRRRAIGRAGVHDDQLDVAMGLADDALHRFGQKRRMVLADDHHRGGHVPLDRPARAGLESARL